LQNDPLQNVQTKPGVVAHAFNPSTREAEAGRFLSRGQPGPQSELQDSQNYKEKPCLKTNKQTNTKNPTTTKQKTKNIKCTNLAMLVVLGTGSMKKLDTLVLCGCCLWWQRKGA
jgi:hypothetical protein